MMSGMLPALAIAVGLVAWGCHSVMPLLAADDVERERLRWRLIALPLALLALLATLVRVVSMPDPAIGAGLLPLGASKVLPIVSVLITLLLAVDTLLLIARENAEALVWKLAAGIGLVGLLGMSAIEEFLRIGSGPSMPIPAFLAALVIRTLVALALALAVADRLNEFDRETRPVFPLRSVPPAAGLAIAGYGFLLPSEVRARLWSNGDVLTLGAAALLLMVARFVPHRLRRIAVIAGGCLSALAFARAAEISQAVGERLHTVAQLLP